MIKFYFRQLNFMIFHYYQITLKIIPDIIKYSFKILFPLNNNMNSKLKYDESNIFLIPYLLYNRRNNIENCNNKRVNII
jgi:hypothetical protein